MEFTYQGVKQAWLERKLNGKTDGWGRVERPKQIEQETEKPPALEDEVVSVVDMEDTDIIAGADAETEMEDMNVDDDEAPPTPSEDAAPSSEVKGDEPDDAK